MSFITELRYLDSIIVIFCLAIFYIIYKSKKYYEEYLKQAINMHRFSLDYFNSTETNQILTQQMAEAALQQADEDSQLFAFEILRRQDVILSMQTLLPALNSNSDQVRFATIQYLRKHCDAEAAFMLEKQLKQERKPELIWEISQTLLHHSKVDLHPYLENWQNSHEPALLATALSINLEHSNKDISAENLTQLKTFFSSEDSTLRMWGARLIESTNLHEMTPYVFELLQDDSPMVVNAAIESAVQHHNPEIIYDLMTKISDSRYYTQAQKTLLTLGAKIFPQLKIHLSTASSIHTISVLLSGLS